MKTAGRNSSGDTTVGCWRLLGRNCETSPKPMTSCKKRSSVSSSPSIVSAPSRVWKRTFSRFCVAGLSIRFDATVVATKSTFARLQDSSLDSSSVDFFQPASTELSSSQYAINSEDREQQENALWQAVRVAIQRFKDEKRFRDLQIVEMLFYAQLRNKDIGELVGIDEKQVALVKHRLIKRLQETLGGQFTGTLADESMLSRMWEEHRPSCPKRSTVRQVADGNAGARLGSLRRVPRRAVGLSLLPSEP